MRPVVTPARFSQKRRASALRRELHLTGTHQAGGLQGNDSNLGVTTGLSPQLGSPSPFRFKKWPVTD